MSLESFLEKLNHHPESIDFAEVIALVDANYDFTPTAFQNGETHNAAGQNSGSCKLFSFAKLQNLSQAQTLACFGAFYSVDVLENPMGDNHQNIRNFIKFAWDGINFEGNALVAKV